MDLKQIVSWMMQNGYMVSIKGNYKVTAKFNREMKGAASGGGLVMTGSGPQMVESSTLAVMATENSPLDWTALYLQFIVQAQVPSRAESSRGTYDLNKYTEDGMKAFRDAIQKDKADPSMLLLATRLYYESHKQFAKTIHNYITQGLWRTDYAQLVQKANEGGVDAVKDHIKNEKDAGEDYSRYRLG